MAINDITADVGDPVSVILPEALEGSPPYIYSLTGLPQGLAFNASTREVSGQIMTAGISEATYIARDLDGREARETFNVIGRAAVNINTIESKAQELARMLVVTDATQGNQWWYNDREGDTNRRGSITGDKTIVDDPTPGESTRDVALEIGTFSFFSRGSLWILLIRRTDPQPPLPVAFNQWLSSGRVTGDNRIRQGYAFRESDPGNIFSIYIQTATGQTPIEVKLNEDISSSNGASHHFMEVQFSGDDIRTLQAVGNSQKINIVIAQRSDYIPPAGLSPKFVEDITGEIGDTLDVTLPEATGGTAPLTYSVTGLPQGLTFVPATRRLHGTYQAMDNALVTYRVADGTGATEEVTFRIVIGEVATGTNVANINREIEVPARTEAEDETPTPTGLVPLPINLVGDTTGRNESIRFTWQATRYPRVLLAWVEIGFLQPSTNAFLPLEGTQPRRTLAQDEFFVIDDLTPGETYAGRIRFQDPTLADADQYSDYVVSDTVTTESDATTELAFPVDQVQDTIRPNAIQVVRLPRAEGGQGDVTYSYEGSLPTGYSFNPFDLQIAGSTTAIDTFRGTLKAVDEMGAEAFIPVEIFVVAELLSPRRITDLRFPLGTDYAALPAGWVSVEWDAPAVDIRNGAANSYNVRIWRIQSDAQQVHLSTIRLQPNIAVTDIPSSWGEFFVTVTPINAAGSGLSITETARAGTGGAASPEEVLILPAIADQELTAGEQASVRLPLAYGGTGRITYELEGLLQQGLAFLTGSRRIVGRPQRVGHNVMVALVATDEGGQTARRAFTINIVAAPVVAEPDAPAFPVATFPRNIGVNQLVNIKLPDAMGGRGVLSYALSRSLPSGLRYTAATNRISGRTAIPLTRPWAGTLTVTDDNGNTATLQVQLGIQAEPPELVKACLFSDPSDEFRITQGHSRTIYLDRAVGEGCTYSLRGAPAWITPVRARVWRASPPLDTPAISYSFRHRVTNEGGSHEQTITVVVEEAPVVEPTVAAPVFPRTSASFAVTRGQTLVVELDAATGTSIRYSLINRPSWMVHLGGRKYRLSPPADLSLPANQPSANVNVNHKATNAGGSDTQTVVLRVKRQAALPAPTTPAPVFEDPSDTFEVTQGQTKTITLDSATGTGVRYSTRGRPSWMNYLGGRRYFLRPPANQPAINYPFTHQVANDGGDDEQTIIIKVNAIPAIDKKPVFVSRGVSVEVTQGQSSRIILPSAQGGDGPLTYRLDGGSLPQGLSRSGFIISGKAQTVGQSSSGSWIVRDADGDEVSIPVSIKVVAALSAVRNLSATAHPLFKGLLIIDWDRPSTGSGTITYDVEVTLDRSGGKTTRRSTKFTSRTISSLVSSETYQVSVTPRIGIIKGPVASTSGRPA